MGFQYAGMTVDDCALEYFGTTCVTEFEWDVYHAAQQAFPDKLERLFRERTIDMASYTMPHNGTRIPLLAFVITLKFGNFNDAIVKMLLERGCSPTGWFATDALEMEWCTPIGYAIRYNSFLIFHFLHDRGYVNAGDACWESIESGVRLESRDVMEMCLHYSREHMVDALVDPEGEHLPVAYLDQHVQQRLAELDEKATSLTAQGLQWEHHISLHELIITNTLRDARWRSAIRERAWCTTWVTAMVLRREWKHLAPMIVLMVLASDDVSEWNLPRQWYEACGYEYEKDEWDMEDEEYREWLEEQAKEPVSKKLKK